MEGMRSPRGWRLHLPEDPSLGRKHLEGLQVEWVGEVEGEEVRWVVWGVDCQVLQKDTTRLMRIMTAVLGEHMRMDVADWAMVLRALGIIESGETNAAVKQAMIESL